MRRRLNEILPEDSDFADLNSANQPEPDGQSLKEYFQIQ